MKRAVEDDQTLRRYLLNDLPPEERQRLEERLLDDRDDDFFKRLQIAETELEDDYITGELSGGDRARFTEYYLSTPERHEKLRFTQLLRDHFAADAPLKKRAAEGRAPRPWLQRLALLLGLDRPAVGVALACGLVVVAGIAAWFGLRTWELTRRLEQLQARQTPAPADHAAAALQQQLAEERARREAAAQELAREQALRAGLEQEVGRLRARDERETAGAKPPPERRTAQPPQSTFTTLAVTLTSGLVRDSGETKVLNLTPQTATVRLRLDLGAESYQSYRAALENAEGDALLTRGRLRPQKARAGRVVSLDVPAGLLRAGGDFQLRLGGVTRGGVTEEVGTYHFRVMPN